MLKKKKDIFGRRDVVESFRFYPKLILFILIMIFSFKFFN